MTISPAMPYLPAFTADSAPRLNHDVADARLIAPLIAVPRRLLHRSSARCSCGWSHGTHRALITLKTHHYRAEIALFGGTRKNRPAVRRGGTASACPGDLLRYINSDHFSCNFSCLAAGHDGISRHLGCGGKVAARERAGERQ
jgi:hypothetical protein